MKIRLLLILLIFLTYSCQKEEKDPMEKAYKNTAWMIDKNSEFPLLGIHENGSIIAIKTNNNGNPIGAVYKKNIDSPGFYVLADSKGYPYRAFINGIIILFENYSYNKVDVAFILPDGEIEIAREIKFDPPKPVNLKSLKSDALQQTDISLGDAIHWGGHALSIGMCVGSIAAAGFSLGALSPLAAISCGAAIVSVSLEFAPEDWTAVKTSSAAFGIISSGIGCIGKDPGACASLFTSTTDAVVNNYEEYSSKNESEIQLAHGGLISPIGNVPADVNEFINEELLNILKDKGLTIYTGFSPPIVEGNYYINSLKNWETGTDYIDYTYKFENQTGILEIDVDYTNSSGTSTATANKAYISGSGNNFSIFAEFRSIEDRGSHTVRITTASIISGTYTSNGIKDFTKGFIVTAKSNDLDDEYMDVGASRIVYESDGLAEKVYSYPYNGLKTKSLKKESNNMLFKN